MQNKFSFCMQELNLWWGGEEGGGEEKSGLFVVEREAS
jgi:hypothetical protein